MTTPTALQPDMSKALALLAVGHTMQATAEHTGWPIGRIRALINGQRGWLVDKNGRVYNPNRPGYKAQIPDGVDLADLEWARQLLGDEAPRTLQFREPAPAPETKPASPAKAAKPTPGPAEPPTAPPAKTGSAAIDGPITTDLPITKIQGNPSNIREEVGDVSELAASIRAHGVLQPLTVRPHPKVPGAYELLAGHRRHAAALQAGLTSVPVTIRPDVDDPAVAIEVMLVENVQRRDLNPMEKAEALGKLRARGYSNSLISARTGIAQSTVSYLLALLELDAAGRDKVRKGEISAGEAVNAVREFRKKQRKKAGDDRTWSWEPDFLTTTHPLARKAERMCNAREHTARRRIGRVACGQCWETVIRADERVVIAAEAESGVTE